MTSSPVKLGPKECRPITRRKFPCHAGSSAIQIAERAFPHWFFSTHEPPLHLPRLFFLSSHTSPYHIPPSSEEIVFRYSPISPRNGNPRIAGGVFQPSSPFIMKYFN
ncbi:hypothetical protein RU639_004387 [Aspergillus parasiticus]